MNDPPTCSPPIPMKDSEFVPELESFRFEETSSGNPTILADSSLPDYERFHFEIDSEFLFENPWRDPLSEDVDRFIATDDSIPPGIENVEDDSFPDLSTSRPPAKPLDGADDVLKILPTQPTRDSEIDFAFIIWVFQPFFSYPLISSLFHSTGSEDTVFDPGISVFAGCPSHLLPQV